MLLLFRFMKLNKLTLKYVAIDFGTLYTVYNCKAHIVLSYSIFYISRG